MVTRNSTAALRGKRRTNQITDRQAYAMLRQLKKALAILTQRDVQEFDRMMMTGGDGVSRRLGLAILGMTGAELLRRANVDTEQAETFNDLIDHVADCACRMRELADFFDKAVARMVVAIASRPDYESIAAKRKARVRVEASHG